MQEEITKAYNATIESLDVSPPEISIKEKLKAEKLYEKNLHKVQTRFDAYKELTISGTKIKMRGNTEYRVRYTTTNRFLSDAILLNNFKGLTIEDFKKEIHLCLLEKTNLVFLLRNYKQIIWRYACKGETPVTHWGDYTERSYIKHERRHTIFLPNGNSNGYIEVTGQPNYWERFPWIAIYIEPLENRVFIKDTTYDACNNLENLLRKHYKKYPYPDNLCDPKEWKEYNDYMLIHPNHTVVSRDEYKALTIGLDNPDTPREYVKHLTHSVVIPKHWKEFPGAYALDFKDKSSLTKLIANVCMYSQEIKKRILLNSL